MIVRDHSGSHAAALGFQVPPHQRVSLNSGISWFCIPSSIAHRALPFEYKQRDPHTPPSWPKHVWEEGEKSVGATGGGGGGDQSPKSEAQCDKYEWFQSNRRQVTVFGGTVVEFGLFWCFIRKKLARLSVLSHASEVSLSRCSISVTDVFKTRRSSLKYAPTSAARISQMEMLTRRKKDKLYVSVWCHSGVCHWNSVFVKPPKPHRSCILHKSYMEHFKTCTSWTTIINLSPHAETRRDLLSVCPAVCPTTIVNKLLTACL